MRTYFNADEYWQSLEVAHVAVFGYGHLTWEWDAAVRGFAHPAVFAALYTAARWLHVDTVPFLVWAPRVVQAAFAALADVSITRLARRCNGNRARAWALFCTLACWFNFFCAVRTLSSCIETALSAAAAAMWPSQCIIERGDTNTEVYVATAATHWQRSRTSRKKRVTQNGGANSVAALSLAAAACVIRPTAMTYWLPIFFLEASRVGRSGSVDRTHGIVRLLSLPLPIASCALSFTTVTDRLFYGRWEFTTINFLKFNLLNDGSVHYGVHPWYWYLTQGLPSVATVYLPLAAFALFVQKCESAFPSLLALSCIIVGHSAVKHKEFRFMMPTLPFFLALSGVALASVANGTHATSRFKRRYKGKTCIKKSRCARWFCIACVLITQIPPAIYLSLWHQFGSIAVMPILSNTVSSNLTHSGGILFLTPCHQMPFTTHVHNANVSLRFLECPPKMSRCDNGGSSDGDDASESERFFNDPGAWLITEYGVHEFDHTVCDVVVFKNPAGSLRDDALVPSHVVMFNDTFARLGVKAWLKYWGYRHEFDLFHAHFEVDRDVQSRVWVFTRSKLS